jgi:hypothetical protein
MKTIYLPYQALEEFFYETYQPVPYRSKSSEKFPYKVQLSDKTCKSIDDVLKKGFYKPKKDPDRYYTENSIRKVID